MAQALDYVAALMGRPYETCENACRKGQGMADSRLYSLVSEKPDALEERDFIDAVSRNLRRGRILIIALGDGIRAEALSRLGSIPMPTARSPNIPGFLEFRTGYGEEGDNLGVIGGEAAPAVASKDRAGAVIVAAFRCCQPLDDSFHARLTQ